MENKRYDNDDFVLRDYDIAWARKFMSPMSKEELNKIGKVKPVNRKVAI